MSDKEFVENAEGVHLMWGEFSLCGDAFDIADDPVCADDCGGSLEPTEKKSSPAIGAHG